MYSFLLNFKYLLLILNFQNFLGNLGSLRVQDYFENFDIIEAFGNGSARVRSALSSTTRTKFALSVEHPKKKRHHRKKNASPNIKAITRANKSFTESLLISPECNLDMPESTINPKMLHYLEHRAT